MDQLRVAVAGPRARPIRAVLSAVGVAIGIAAMSAVLGISASGQADLRRTLARLNTDLLTVAAGSDADGKPAELPASAVPMIRRIAPVRAAAGTASVDANVFRSDRISALRTGAIATYAADLELPAVLNMTVRDGVWLSPATAAYPSVVLGATAAERLGFDRVRPGLLVQLGGRTFTVIGILGPSPLVTELDNAAFIGRPAARQYLGASRAPDQIYLRAAETRLADVRAVLAATANPDAPYEVRVSRPSDALVAKLATDRALNAVLLGLGAVGLLVGAIGVTNTMVVSVLERRSEIGLRRSLGATRGQIRAQFLTESLILATAGGAGGVALGAGVTAFYAAQKQWPITVPWWVTAGGLAATVVVGGLAGLYPAIRAARLPPAAAIAGP